MNAVGSATPPVSPLSALPFLPQLCGKSGAAPGDAACFALWDKYAMLPNIRRHSLLVAHIATTLARKAEALGLPVRAAQVRASALLHDIAKTYCVRYGGSHAQVGASWVVDSTGNHKVAQAVYHHVEWPWPLPEDLVHPVFFVIYADKRARHDEMVSLDERYEDLLVRYGKSEHSRAAIHRGWEHSKTIERVLSAQLEFPLHESTVVGGRLVSRA